MACIAIAQLIASRAAPKTASTPSPSSFPSIAVPPFEVIAFRSASSSSRAFSRNAVALCQCRGVRYVGEEDDGRAGRDSSLLSAGAILVDPEKVIDGRAYVFARHPEVSGSSYFYDTGACDLRSHLHGRLLHASAPIPLRVTPLAVDYQRVGSNIWQQV